MIPGVGTHYDLPDVLLKLILHLDEGNSWYRLAHVGVSALVYIPVLPLAHFGGRLLRSLTHRASVRGGFDAQITLLLSRLAYLGLLVLGVVVYVNAISERIAAIMLTSVGLLGLAFGLAFQDILKNWLSGVFLLLERPFRLGDVIKVGDLSGRVETILLRVTVLNGADGQRILLPNQQVYTSAIVVGEPPGEPEPE